MWVRQTSIRPVPGYARVSAPVLSKVRAELLESDESPHLLDDAFQRFEESQPALAERLNELLSQPLQETSLALGYFLSLSVWLAFERSQGRALGEVRLEELEATQELLSLDEELRKGDPAESVDSDDVVAMEQPHLVQFLHEHLDATMDAHGDSIDLEELHSIYRTVLVEILALSYAVKAPVGYPMARSEVMA